VKSYVRNTINLSCAKIVFPSVINVLTWYENPGYIAITTLNIHKWKLC